MNYSLLVPALALLLAAPVAADGGDIDDPMNTLGKGRAAVQRMCKAADGDMREGNCFFEDGSRAVMFTYKGGRVDVHTAMASSTIYGYMMLKLIRKTAGEEDVAFPKNGCDLYMWADIEGYLFSVFICEDDDTSGVAVTKN